jgi:hypothetical protein
MCDEIEDSVDDFSQANRIRCFLHIVNLVAKSLLKQFDASKTRANDSGRDLETDEEGEELEHQIEELLQDIDIDEALTQDLYAENDSVGDDDDEDDVDGLVDETTNLSTEELAELRSAT